MSFVTESLVEDAALAWLNPDLPVEALGDLSRTVTLAALRDTLLPKLLSDDLRHISGTAKLVEAGV